MKLLISESCDFCPRALERLRGCFEVETANLDRDRLIDSLHDVDVLWVRLRNMIDGPVLDAAPRLRAIVTNTTGLTHIDTDHAEARGILVISLRGEVDFLKEIRSTAELTIALTLALLRNIPAAHQHVCSGGWQRDLFKGQELYTKTAGIIGYGRLGRIVAGYFLAMGMRVVAASPGLDAREADPRVQVVSLPELLQNSDVVSLHASYEANNRKMISQDEFALMKPGSWFINTARGELVDERALLDALRSGHLAGTAIDVVDGEQQQAGCRSELTAFAQAHDNLIITPHIGGNTVESTEKTELFLAERLVTLLHENESLRAAGRSSCR